MPKSLVQVNKTAHSNDNYKSISPVQELRFLDLIQSSRVSATARNIGHWIVRWTNADDSHPYHGYSWAGRNKLAEKIDRKSKTTVSDAVSELVAANLVIVKRRPNATSLIRPNWNLLNQISDDQKTGSPEDQKTVFPEDQKTGPYSTDQDSADLDSADHSFQSAPRLGCNTDTLESSPAALITGRSMKEKEEGFFNSLTLLQWKQDSDDSQFDPPENAERGARVRWHRLLAKKIPADRLVRGAKRFLEITPANQRPYLVGWLCKHAEDCLDPESYFYVPEVEGQPDQRKTANDNQRHAMAAGDESSFGGHCEPDAPF